MLSRVAESIYWLGRYIERAENYARFIDVNFNLMLDLPSNLKAQWNPLISATGDRDLYLAKYDKFERNSAIYFLVFDIDNPNSMYTSISLARENARTVREKITKETWEKLNEIYLLFKKLTAAKVWEQEDPRDYITDIKYRIQLLYGIGDNTVARTESWYFMRLGQFLERADKTSRILDVKYHTLLPSVDEVGSAVDILHWMALLKSVSGFNIYRQLYGNIEPTNIVDFLVLNTAFPRSILYCLAQSERSLKIISGSNGSGFKNLAEKNLGLLYSQLEYYDVNDVIKIGLHEFLDGLQIKINTISDAIHSAYFTAVTPSTFQIQTK